MRRSHSRTGQAELPFEKEEVEVRTPPENPQIPRHNGLIKVLQRVAGPGNLEGVTCDTQEKARALLMDLRTLSEEEISARVKDLNIHVSGSPLAKHAKIDFWETRRGWSEQPLSVQ